MSTTTKAQLERYQSDATLRLACADREVDLPVAFARVLAAFVGDRRDGYLFQNRNGGPMSQRNILRRSLHPILKGMGWTAGDLAGFHVFRRFRVTHLRKQRTHDDLLR